MSSSLMSSSLACEAEAGIQQEQNRCVHAGRRRHARLWICDELRVERERNRGDLPFLGMPLASSRASPGRAPALWCSVHLQAGLGTPFVPRTQKVKGNF